MPTTTKTYFAVEASHLFRAGERFETQIYVFDVVKFLARTFFEGSPYQAIVLHGSTKEEQAIRYSDALERSGAKVVRMRPIPSEAKPGAVYYKPTYYLHNMMGSEIPEGSNLVLIGFHNIRYLNFLKQYSQRFKVSMATFGTPSKKLGLMTIPEEFRPHLKLGINLDEHIQAIKNEFRRTSPETSL